MAFRASKTTRMMAGAGPPRPPWPLFLSFLTSNVLLSTFLLPTWAAWVVGGLGLLAPAVRALQGNRLHPPDLDTQGGATPWLLGVVLVGGLWLRFGGLVSLSRWPLYDEGIYAWHSLGFDEGWDSRLFFAKSNAPALFAWAMALGNRLLEPSLTTLWLVPALFSTAALPFAWFAARRFFGPTTASMVLLFMSLGFLPVFTGRFSFAVVTGLFWACLSLWLLARFLGEADRGKGWGWAVTLGLSLGAGLYTDHPWPAFVLAVLLLPLDRLLHRAPGWKGRSAALVAGIIVAAAPYAWAVLQGQFGSYNRRLFILTSDAGWSHWPVVASYVQVLFWGMPPGVHSYQPLWGGFLDPLSGALVMLGILALFRKNGDGRLRWAGTAFLLLLVPGLLSLGYMPFRVVLVAPFLALFAAIGFRFLFPEDHGRGRMTILLAFAVLVMTGWHLFAVYGGSWDHRRTWDDYVKSPERMKAYRILEGTERREGPGVILTGWVPGQSDETLDYASYRFNAARNPRLDPSRAGWGALMVNVHYQPLLVSLFPAGRSHRLSESRVDGGWMLFVAPLEGPDRPRWDAWVRAHRSLRAFTDRNLRYVAGEPYAEVLSVFADAWPLHRGDPLLRALFWEKAADLYWLGHSHDPSGTRSTTPPGWKEGDGDFVLYCLREAVEEGYPAAHLYRRMGMELMMKGRDREAREAFRTARRSAMDFTDSMSLLDMLERSGASKAR
jgi:hypothetical protein